MTNPVTTIDDRYSQSGMAPTSWEETSRLLAAAQLYWLTTVRAGGQPHATPIHAVWVDETLYFSTGAAEQKAANLRANPYVIAITGGNNWEHGIDVVVEGEARRVTETDTLHRLAAAWRQIWDGRWQYEVRDDHFTHPGGSDPVLVFAVAPTKILAFAKGPFGHTTHRF